VSDAGSGSEILRLRRKIPLLFEEKSLKAVCFDSLIYKSKSRSQELQEFSMQRVGRGSVRAGVGASSSAQAELRSTVILHRMEAD